MNFFSVRMLRRALRSSATHVLSLYVLICLSIMPVVTRSQSRQRYNNTNPSIKTECSTSSPVESLNTALLLEHLTSPNIESLDVPLSFIASTSHHDVRLDLIKTDSSILTIDSTSPNTGCLDHASDSSHLNIRPASSSSLVSLDQPSLKFQNVSELAEFQISKSSSLVTCASSDIYPLPTSINSSFSNSFIM